MRPRLVRDPSDGSERPIGETLDAYLARTGKRAPSDTVTFDYFEMTQATGERADRDRRPSHHNSAAT